MSNIFNNIKVLTDLEVKNTATMKQGLIVSGSVSGTTGLHVEEDARIEGELYIGGQVINRGYAQIGALVVEGLTSLSGNLIVTGSQILDGNLSVNGGTISIDGEISGTFDLTANGNVSASTGHYNSLSAGVLNLNSLYLPGNFGVSGSAILGQNLNSIITSVGQFTASNGIEAATNGFNAANGTGYKLKGTEALKENSGVIVLQSGSLNKIQLGNLGIGGAMTGYEGIKIVSKDATSIVSPRTFLRLTNAGPIELDISSESSKFYNSSGDVLLSGSNGIYAESNLFVEKTLKLSGSANFKNITSVTRDGNGLYDVAAAITAIDDFINTGDRNYAKMRFAHSGSIGASTLTLNLVELGADSVFFATNQLNYLVADVMIRISNTEAWTNDLTSVQIYNDNGSIKVDIDVPAAEAGWEYRIIIVNENGEMFI